MPIVTAGRTTAPVDLDEPLNLHAAGRTRGVEESLDREPSVTPVPPIKAEPIAPRPAVIREEPVPMRFAADAADTYPSDARDAPERPRPAVLPIAVTLVAGLLLGFMAGYFVGGRETGPVVPSSTGAAAVQPSAPTSAPSPSQPQSPAADAGARAATTPTQQPASVPHASAAPPTVPEDGAIPPPSKPSASSGHTPPPAPAATSGRIVVRSSPAKASVTLNGRWRGRTPLTLDGLPFGHYVVRVVQPGYRAEQSEVALSAKDTARSLNVRLSREPAPASPSTTARSTAKPETSPSGGYTGVLFIDSRPQGAAVLLDGHLVGKTPLRLPDVRIGSHVVRLELSEHQAWTASTRVSAGQESRVTGSLERLQ